MGHDNDRRQWRIYWSGRSFRRKKVAAPSPKPVQSGGGVIEDVPRQCLNLIKAFEGCHEKRDGRIYAYPDPLSGNLPITIGWGTTRNFDGSPFDLGDSISQESADDLLRCQVRSDYMAVLAETVPHWGDMSENQKSALTSFAYNLGANFMNANGFNTIQTCLREKDWEAVPSALMLYVNPGSNVEAGLRRRREAEGELWRE